MTAPRRDNQHQSGFLEWVRAVPGLDSRRERVCCMDIDIIWEKFRASFDIKDRREIYHMMLIEEKSYGADITGPQREMMWFTHQLLTAGATRLHVLRDTKGRDVNVKYWGYYKLRYDGKRPDVSQRIWWNRGEINLSQLESILRFDLRPDNLTPNDPRINHHARSERHPVLPFR